VERSPGSSVGPDFRTLRVPMSIRCSSRTAVVKLARSARISSFFDVTGPMSGEFDALGEAWMVRGMMRLARSVGLVNGLFRLGMRSLGFFPNRKRDGSGVGGAVFGSEEPNDISPEPKWVGAVCGTGWARTQHL